VQWHRRLRWRPWGPLRKTLWRTALSRSKIIFGGRRQNSKFVPVGVPPDNSPGLDLLTRSHRLLAAQLDGRVNGGNRNVRE
jgi:hypothetical protein